MSPRLIVRRLITGAALLLSLSWVVAAQDNDLSQPSPSSGSSAPSNATPSADDLVWFLSSNSDLLASVKAAVLRKAHEQRELLDTTDLTDDAFERIIREDASARLLVAQKIQDYNRVRTPPVSSEQEPDATTLPFPEMELGTTEVPRSRMESEGILPSKTESELGNPAAFRRQPRDSSLTGPQPAAGDFTTIPPTRRQAVPPPVEDQNRPVTTKQPNPYPDLPSAQDLYRQFPNKESSLKRFGDDVFLNGTGNLEALPMDLPAGPEYVLGPGDGLNITLWGSISQRIAATVDRQGQIVLPESGGVVVAGHTLADAQLTIQRVLSTQFKTARVSVSLTRLRTIRVYVVGDVKRPGAYDISSLSTPLNALYVAGGPTLRGSLRTVRHYRGKELVRVVDLYDLILHGVRTSVARLEPGDTILVPTVGSEVSVAGMVRRPGIYELTQERDLSEVLQLAGGVLVSATLRHVTVERIEAHQRRVLLSLNLPDGNSNDESAIQKALGNFAVQDGDRITISPILPYSDKTVYLQGHVFRPGKYPYREGTQIADIIRSYQDLLPEPAQHAEIVRLVPPDYRPEVIEFNLGDVLGGDDPIDLQPFDTIRIFGRYEIDPPKVSIYGEVLRPGKYPLSQDMTAAALVRMAGGFKRSAFQQEADITSYVVQNDDRIRTQHETVQIAKALNGDSAADAILKPNDVLTIRQLSGWSDIGASVTIKGEVAYPGTYGIEEGEKLSQFIRRAGGFRKDAYPDGAVLERVQARELAEQSRAALIRRIESESAKPKLSATSSGQDQAAFLQAASQQRDEVLTALKNQPASGRLVINISADIERWQGTIADVELRAGDEITIPKMPGFVAVSGQVYNAAAITYNRGKNAAWYLRQAGGPTELANRKDIYIIHANGSVVGRGSGSLWSGGVLDTTLLRGDTIVVPEKIIGGTSAWKNLLDTAQLTSSLAIAARVATSF